MTTELALVSEAVKRSNVSDVARRLGVSRGSVLGWMAGTSAPRAKACATIRATLSAHTDLTKPRGPAPQDGTASGRHETGAGPRAALLDDHDDPRANALAALRKIRVALDNVDANDAPTIARLSTPLTGLSRLLAKLTGQIDVSETMLLRSMGWARIKTALVEAVRPYPEAARALAEAIEKISAAA